MTNVKTDFLVGKDEVTKALRKQQAEIDKLKAKQQQLADKSKQAAQASKGATDTSNRGLQQMAAGAAVAAIAYRSLTTAIRLGNDELREQVRLNDLSRDTNITLAQAQSKLITNIGDVSDKQLGAFESRLKGIRREAKLSSLAPVTAAAANILSALGGEPTAKRERALQITAAAAPFFRQDVEALPEFGSALGDISTAVGVSPEKALGFALSVQQSARIEELGGLSKLAPLIAGARVVRQPGVDPLLQARQATAFAAGFGTSIADPFGRRTKTAGAALFPKLAEATPGGTIFEQVERVRADESGRLREKILKGAFATDVKPFLREFLTGTGGETGANVAAAFPTIDVNVAASRRKRRQLEIGTEALKIATTAAEIEGTAEANLLGDLPAARAANARKALATGLLRTRSFFTRTPILTAFDLEVADPFGVAGDPSREAIRILEGEKTTPLGRERSDAVVAKLDTLIDIMERQLAGQSPVSISSELDQ
jgi:hypothetical protein